MQTWEYKCDVIRTVVVMRVAVVASQFERSHTSTQTDILFRELKRGLNGIGGRMKKQIRLDYGKIENTRDVLESKIELLRVQFVMRKTSESDGLVMARRGDAESGLFSKDGWGRPFEIAECVVTCRVRSGQK
jgi:hypothetical protein